MTEQMSEMVEQTDGATIESALPPSVETVEEKPAIEKSNGHEKPPGYAPIDIETAAPEEIKQRIDYLFRQIKDQKRTDQTIRQYRELAEQQSRQIEELTNGFNGVVNHLQDKTFNETEAQLTQAMQAAFESGDMKSYIENQNKLISIKTEKGIAEIQKKNAPKPEKKSEAAPQNVPMAQLSDEDQLTVDTWQDERDQSGNILRPWAHNRGTEENPDPEYMAALNETLAVLRNPRFKNATMEQKMAEVDKRMGVNKTNSFQNVMGGGLTGGRKIQKMTLSPKQQEIALKTGSRDKTDAEKLEWYRKQLEKVQSKKGAKA